MKRFVIKVLAFALIVATIFVGWSTLVVVAEINAYKQELVLPEGCDIVVVGDSQPEHALDPRFWPRLYNFSKTATAMDQRYMKLVDIFRANPGRIRMLLLDISAIKFYGGQSDLMDLARKDGYYDRQFFLHWLHPKENERSLDGTLSAFRDGMLMRKTKMAWRVLRGKKKYESSIGGSFLDCQVKGFESNRNEVENSAEELARSTDKSVADDEFVRHLDEILGLSKTNDVEVILFSTPIHRELVKRMMPGKLDDFTRSIGSIAGEAGLKYLDFTTMELPDECWRDANHLNALGAELFTKAIAGTVDKIANDRKEQYGK